MPSGRRVSWAKLRVIAVSLAAVAILVVLLYLLAGGTLLTPQAHLYLYISDATGLAAGSPVRVDGIAVGKVDTVTLSNSNQPNRVLRVTMRVEEKHLRNIPADSWAQLTSETLIGDKFVDVTSGKSADHIRANGEIPYKEQLEMMKSLDLTQFAKQLREVDAMITDIEQGKSRVGQFVLGDETYKGVIRQINTIGAAFRAAIKVTSPAGSAVYTSTLYQQVDQPLKDLDQALARLQSGQGSAGILLRDDAQYQQAVASLKDLRSTIEQVRANDVMKTDQMYSGWLRNVAQLMRSVDEFNASPWMSGSGTYESLNGAAREMRDSVKDFRENPRKYLYLKLF